VFTTADPKAAPPALTGMDLVRLGLERGATADEALDVLTRLIERHGQGGSGEEHADEPYWSSFLVADPRGAWVLETSDRTWAARRVDDGAAISNRVALGTAWDRASADVAPGTDVNGWLDPNVPVEAADVRLAATTACVATGAGALDAPDIVATLRHHGTRPWGAPGARDGVEPPPPPDAPEWSGFTVCWHLRGVLSTTASVVADLPADPASPMRVWAALGSPCASVFVPLTVSPDGRPGAPRALADAATWRRFAALRDRVEADGAALAEVRAVLAPVEDALWAAPTPPPSDEAEAALDAALTRLGV
jgi:secernin